MAETEQKAPSRAGCALMVLAVIAAIVGVGLWLGQRKDSALAPCDRYAKAVRTGLDNCHSGVNRDFEYHRDHCERELGEVTEECLGEIERMSLENCDRLERLVRSKRLCLE